MEIRDLRIFQAVAQHGSISKAAKELNYVQSNVTARIQQLEIKLQTPLFYRHSRGMTLNSEGKRLLSYVEKILAMMDEMVESFQDKDNPRGTLEIGSVETVVKLPVILSAYHHKYSQVDLSLITGVTSHLIREVINGKLDGAFVTGPVEHPHIIQEQVFEEELVLVANARSSSLDDIKTKPLLVFGPGCGYRARLRRWLESEGIVPGKEMEFGTLETILGSVVSGLGITLIPKMTVKHLEAEGEVRCYAIPKEYSIVSTVFVYRSGSHMTNALAKFIETIRIVRNEQNIRDR
ncbi:MULTISPECIES: LysR family transcriptional regulator [Aneurinibacillus]|uniref:DNA-binding transcriptional regulator, LysR family n=1 Tax=Aneurinibacillus thermoaerophilus TaxID=143495 RepID=A0A1G8AK66_ANETH|nr:MULTISPECIES: LysR family transcriptional regulator [Aneurinibacillus]AMA71494.1 LysR family transcriptional regulator [Aneurinibacillus sp. XH2]MED0675327.1 LysR family transcriptional regulator [Aneurinibacillus thermoaerophilus]MED0678620.1 LysR family transcriptional regulator [Aneurinibacillus thermoaerophilus]MED0738291.1 LysR family transcriptional regulator [Aneurinibacillus thermoaerophilus]MED0756574.1 LysR family transcriptional regulator [Aneurinibacillus thermoaerophilus]